MGTSEEVTSLTSPEGLADDEVMTPVDMRGVGQDFDDVDTMVEKLGNKGTVEAFVKAQEYFAANKDKEPEDERPKEMSAAEWRDVLASGMGEDGEEELGLDDFCEEGEEEPLDEEDEEGSEEESDDADDGPGLAAIYNDNLGDDEDDDFDEEDAREEEDDDEIDEEDEPQQEEPRGKRRKVEDNEADGNGASNNGESAG